MTEHLLQLSSALSTSLDGLDTLNGRPLDRIAETYILAEVAISSACSEDQKRIVCQGFTSAAHATIDFNRRSVRQASDLAALEEFAQAMSMKLFRRARGTRSNNHILGDALLSLLDWRYSSRYKACEGLKALFRKNKVKGNLSQPALSRLDKTGAGLSLDRFSQVLGVLGVSPSFRPCYGLPRVIVRESTVGPGPHKHQSKKSEGHPNTASFSFEDITRLDQLVAYWALGETVKSFKVVAKIKQFQVKDEPWVILGHNETPVTRLLIMNFWTTMVNPDQNNKEYLKGLAFQYAPKLGPYVKVHTEILNRSYLSSHTSALEPGDALLLSAFDVGTPLVAGLTCLKPSGILHEGLTAAMNFLRKHGGATQIIKAVAELSLLLGENNPDYQGAVPQSLPLDGIQSGYLIIRMKNGFDLQSQEKETHKDPGDKNAPLESREGNPGLAGAVRKEDGRVSLSTSKYRITDNGYPEKVTLPPGAKPGHYIVFEAIEKIRSVSRIAILRFQHQNEENKSYYLNLCKYRAKANAPEKHSAKAETPERVEILLEEAEESKKKYNNIVNKEPMAT